MWFAQTILGSEIDVLAHDATLPDLAATNKADAVREIVAQLSAAGAIDREHETEIIQSLLKREDLGSTGIGKGFAIPHVKHASVNRSIVAMALSRNGIDFNSLDDRPVHIIFLMVSPTNRAGDHLRALQRISEYLGTQ